MDSIAERTTLDTVTAPVQFLIDTGETPVSKVQQPGEGQDERTGKFEYHDVVIHDGRPLADELDLDRHGFRLLRRDTAMTDFYDEAQVREIYYPETEKLVQEITGAASVLVFDHTIRFDDEAAQNERAVRAPVRIAHNDFTERSAPQRVRDLLPEAEAEERLSRRFGSINIWRPIEGPVETSPVMICEWDSLEDENMIAAERHYEGRVGGILSLSYNPEQRWYYFPKMERDEVVALKCFDSLTDGTARWTAHGSFEDPNTPEGARPRQSIEMRTLYFFD